MLVLSRKPGAAVQIADNISITVSHVRGGRVQLCIEAPKTVRVVRKELESSDAVLCKENTVAAV